MKLQIWIIAAALAACVVSTVAWSVYAQDEPQPVSGWAFQDFNGSGRQEKNDRVFEPGIAGLRIHDAAAPDVFVITSESGFFTLPGLISGDLVCDGAPCGYLITGGGVMQVALPANTKIFLPNIEGGELMPYRISISSRAQRPRIEAMVATALDDSTNVTSFWTMVKAAIFTLILLFSMWEGAFAQDGPTLVVEEVTGVTAAASAVLSCEPLIPTHLPVATTDYSKAASVIFLPLAVQGPMCPVVGVGSHLVDLGDVGDLLATNFDLYRYAGLTTAQIDQPTATASQLRSLMTRRDIPAGAQWRLVHAQSFTPSVTTYSRMQELPSSWLEKYLGEILHYVDTLPYDVVVSFPTSTPVNIIPSLVGASALGQRCPAVANRAGIGGIVEGFFWLPQENAWMVVVGWVDTTMLTACPWMEQNIFVPGAIASVNLPANIRQEAERYADLAARDWEFSAPIIPRPGELPSMGTVTIATVAAGAGTVAVFARMTGGGSAGGGGLYVFSAMPGQLSSSGE